MLNGSNLFKKEGLVMEWNLIKMYRFNRYWKLNKSKSYTCRNRWVKNVPKASSELCWCRDIIVLECRKIRLLFSHYYSCILFRIPNHIMNTLLAVLKANISLVLGQMTLPPFSSAIFFKACSPYTYLRNKLDNYNDWLIVFRKLSGKLMSWFPSNW